MKQSYDSETVLGPNNEDWFEEASTQKQSSSFAEHVKATETPRSENSFPPGFETPQRRQENEERSPFSAAALFDSQNSCTPPTVWSRLSLGASPVGLSQLCVGGTQTSPSLAISLGANVDDSVLSWTSSLATPPRDTSDGRDTEVESPGYSKTKDLARALFSPGLQGNLTDDSASVLDITVEEEKSLNEESLPPLNEGNQQNLSSWPTKSGIKRLFQRSSSTKKKDPSEKSSGKKLEISDIDNYCTGKEKETSVCRNREIKIKKNSRTNLSKLRQRTEKCLSPLVGDSVFTQNNRHGLQLTKPGGNNTLESNAITNPQEDNNGETDETGDDSNASTKKVKQNWSLKKTISKAKASRQSSQFSQKSKTDQNKLVASPKLSRRRLSVNSRVIAELSVDEALSDFFDPPSSAVGRRKCAPRGVKRKSIEIDEVDLQGFGDRLKCSTPKDTGPVLLSILSSKKKKQSKSCKKVRFQDSMETVGAKDNVKTEPVSDTVPSASEVNKVVDIKMVESGKKDGGKIPRSRHLHLGTEEQTRFLDSSVSSVQLKQESNVDEIEEKLSESGIGILEDESDIDDALFSQLSPTALSEMCTVAEETSGSLVVTQNKSTQNKNLDIPVSTADADGHVNYSKKSSLKVNANISTERQQFSSVQSKLPVANKFLYPSKSQIVGACSKRVFEFSSDIAPAVKGIVKSVSSDDLVVKADLSAESEEKDKKSIDRSSKHDAYETDHSACDSDLLKANRVTDQVQPGLGHSPVQSKAGDAQICSLFMQQSQSGFVEQGPQSGFRSASGRNILLSDEVLERARSQVFGEQLSQNATATHMGDADHSEAGACSSDQEYEDLFDGDIDLTCVEMLQDQEEQTAGDVSKNGENLNDSGFRSQTGKEESVKIHIEGVPNRSVGLVPRREDLLNEEQVKVKNVFQEKVNRECVRKSGYSIRKEEISLKPREVPTKCVERGSDANEEVRLVHTTVAQDPHPGSLGGFATASGHFVKMSSAALKQAEKLMLDTETDEIVRNTNSISRTQKQQSVTGGRSSGSRTVGCVTDKKKETSLHIRQNQDAVVHMEIDSDTLTKDNQNEKDNHIFHKSNWQANRIKSSVMKSCQQGSASCSSSSSNRGWQLGGFSTASGRDISLSISSLQKAQELMVDDSSDNSFSVEKPPASIKAERQILSDVSQLTSSSLKRKPTAMARKEEKYVTVSDYETNNKPDIDTISCDNIPSASSLPSVGFRTAGGEDIGLGTAALLKAETLLMEVDDQDDSKAFHLLNQSGVNSTVCKTLQQANQQKQNIQNIKGEGEKMCVSFQIPSEFTSAKSTLKVTSNLKRDFSGQASALSKFDRFVLELQAGNNSQFGSGENLCETDSAELELENMLKSKKTPTNKSIGSANRAQDMNTAATQSKRFPPGATVPKGFRPFKAPRVTRKPTATKLSPPSTCTIKNLKHSTDLPTKKSSVNVHYVDLKTEMNIHVPVQKDTKLLQSSHTSSSSLNDQADVSLIDQKTDTSITKIYVPSGVALKKDKQVTAPKPTEEISSEHTDIICIKVNSDGTASTGDKGAILTCDDNLEDIYQGLISQMFTDDMEMPPLSSPPPSTILNSYCSSEDMKDNRIENFTIPENKKELDRSLKQEIVYSDEKETSCAVKVESESEISAPGHLSTAAVTQSNRTAQVVDSPSHAAGFTRFVDGKVFGFSTASGKDVTVSNSALESARNLLDTCTSEEELTRANRSSVGSGENQLDEPKEATDVLAVAKGIVTSEQKHENSKENVSVIKEEAKNPKFDSSCGKALLDHQQIESDSLGPGNKNISDCEVCDSSPGEEFGMSWEEDVDYDCIADMDENCSGTAHGAEIKAEKILMDKADHNVKEAVADVLQSGDKKATDSGKTGEVQSTCSVNDIPEQKDYNSGYHTNLCDSERKRLVEDVKSTDSSVSGDRIGISERTSTKSGSHSMKKSPNILNQMHASGTFLGFQTASGRSVKIAEDSLAAARKVLETETFDVSDNQITDIDFSAVQDRSQMNSNCPSKHVSRDPVTDSSRSSIPFKCKADENSVASLLALKDLEVSGVGASGINNKSVNMNEHMGTCVFQTASGRSVGVGEASLATVREKQLIPAQFPTSGGVTCSDTCSTPGNEGLYQLKDSYSTGGNSSKMLVPQTAAEHCFEKEVHGHESNRSEAVFKESIKLFHSDGNERKDQENGVNLQYQHEKMENLFQTAGGKSVCVSESALNQARLLMNKNEETTVRKTPSFSKTSYATVSTESSATSPVCTVSGKVVSFSEKALYHAGQRLHEDLTEDARLTSKLTQLKNSSFLKSNSEDSVLAELAGKQAQSEKTCNIIEIYDDKNTVKKNRDLKSSSIFLKASENVADVSDTTVKHSGQFWVCAGVDSEGEDHKVPCQNNNLNDDLKSASLGKFSCGFKTAGGESVTVAEEALARGRRLLDTIEEEAGKSDSVESVETMSSKIDHGPPCSRAVKEFGQACCRPGNLSVGNVFQTASGKSVIISDSALTRAREVLNEDGDIGSEEEVHSVNLTEKQFKTASGRAVAVSGAALSKAREVFLCEDDYTCDIQQENQVKLNGDAFKAASGKAFSFSDQALSDIEQRFEDNCLLRLEEGMNGRQTIAGMFLTANGKSVNISDGALMQAKRFLHDDDVDNIEGASCKNQTDSALININRSKLEDNKNNSSTSPATRSLFQTASGKSIDVSEDALIQTKEKFPENNLPLTCSISVDFDPKITFQTAGGSSLVVSEKALAMAKQALDVGEETKAASGNSDQSSVENDEKTLVKKEVNDVLTKSEEEDKDHVVTGSGASSFERLKGWNETVFGEKATSFPGLHTAKGERMTVSGTSLAAVKRKLDDTDQGVQLDKRSLGSNLGVGDCVSPSEIGGQPIKRAKVGEKGENGKKDTSEKWSTFKVPYKVKQIVTVSNISYPRSEVSGKGQDSAMEVDCKDDDAMMEVFTQEEQEAERAEIYYCALVEARRKQEEITLHQQSGRIKPVAGKLFDQKQQSGRQKLRDVFKYSQRQSSEIKSPACRVRASNAGTYRFQMSDYYGEGCAHAVVGDGAYLVPDDQGRLGKEEFYRGFLTMAGVDKNLVNDTWLYNHYRWIVWKLAAYEVAGPQSLTGRCLTPDMLMLQLKYRYDREIDHCHRSCLRKILERDDTACKRMVLCVVSIIHQANNSKPDETEGPNSSSLDSKMLLELTDGWYSLKTQIDLPLTDLVRRGRLKVGQKLCVSGTELIGSEDACSPLEAPGSAMLKICYNNTRPAPWDSRLGYQDDPRPLCLALSGLNGEGGPVGVIDVVIVRKYPIMYMEKMPGGGCVFRSSRAEEKKQQQYQMKQQQEMETLYQQIEKQMEIEKKNEEKACTSGRKWTAKEADGLQSGQEIFEALSSSRQPELLEGLLSESQVKMLLEYRHQLQSEIQQDLNSRVQKAWREKQQSVIERIVTPAVKFRVAGCARKDIDDKITSLLTIWRPSPELSDLQEGKRYKMYNVNTSLSRWKYAGHCQLTATKQTKFRLMQVDENFLDVLYEPREVLWVNDLKRRQPAYGEVDFVGVVIKIVTTTQGDSTKVEDTVYCADCQGSILGIKFWTGVKVFGVEDVIREGEIICTCNLMDKSPYRSPTLPVLEASPEVSHITNKPQNSSHRQALARLKSALKDKKSFLSSTQERLEDILKHKSISTPGRTTPQKNRPSDFPVTPSSCTGTPVLTPQSQTVPGIANTTTPSRKLYQHKMSKLLNYSSPAELSPLPSPVPRAVTRGFKPPAFKKI